MQDGALGPLVERAAAGDEAAFAEIFRRTRADVGRVCRRLLGPGPAAEDAASEVFLRARRSLAGFDRDRPFGPWLLAIASHHCIDLLRRRRTETRLFSSDELADCDLADPAPSPLRRVAGAERRAEVLEAVEGLPEKYRLPLVLRYWSELDYADIADVLGVERSQVATLVYRAKRRLRERLGSGEERP